MADESARLEKAQEQAQRDTVAARVAQLVAMADTARSSGNALDLDSVRQTLGSEAMLDATVAMMEANVRGDLDNVTLQTALTSALAQQKLVESQKTDGVITQAQADQMSAKVVEELKAATPAKSEEPKVEAPAAEVKPAVETAEKPAEHISQVQAMREKLEAGKKDTKGDQVAAEREKQAKQVRGIAS